MYLDADPAAYAVVAALDRSRASLASNGPSLAPPRTFKTAWCGTAASVPTTKVAVRVKIDKSFMMIAFLNDNSSNHLATGVLIRGRRRCHRFMTPAGNNSRIFDMVSPGARPARVSKNDSNPNPTSRTDRHSSRGKSLLALLVLPS
jgi:hypothetical protein